MKCLLCSRELGTDAPSNVCANCKPLLVSDDAFAPVHASDDQGIEWMVERTQFFLGHYFSPDNPKAWAVARNLLNDWCDRSRYWALKKDVVSIKKTPWGDENT